MVIDAGNPSTFPDVDRALKALGITRIDYLVASHPHVDHIGSFAQLLSNYEIGAVYTSEDVYKRQLGPRSARRAQLTDLEHRDIL